MREELEVAVKSADERERALHKLLEELILFGATKNFIIAFINMTEVLSEIGKSFSELSEAMSSEDYDSDIRQRRFLERKYRFDGRCAKPNTKIAVPYQLFRIQNKGCC